MHNDSCLDKTRVFCVSVTGRGIAGKWGGTMRRGYIYAVAEISGVCWAAVLGSCYYPPAILPSTKKKANLEYVNAQWYVWRGSDLIEIAPGLRIVLRHACVAHILIRRLQPSCRSGGLEINFWLQPVIGGDGYSSNPICHSILVLLQAFRERCTQHKNVLASSVNQQTNCWPSLKEKCPVDD